MKKILSLLSAIGIASSIGSTVVACDSNSSVEDKEISKKLAVIMETEIGDMFTLKENSDQKDFDFTIYDISDGKEVEAGTLDDFEEIKNITFVEFLSDWIGKEINEDDEEIKGIELKDFVNFYKINFWHFAKADKGTETFQSLRTRTEFDFSNVRFEKNVNKEIQDMLKHMNEADFDIHISSEANEIDEIIVKFRNGQYKIK